MNEVKERVFRIVSAILRVPLESVTEASSPATIPQWDSLNQMNLIMTLEEEFAIRLTDDQVINLMNVGQIVTTIRDDKGEN